MGKQDEVTRRDMYIMVCAKVVGEPVEYNGDDFIRSSYSDWAKKVVKLADILLQEANKPHE